jgi:Arylsulfatase regulator (Fe-S oxidoreductase)
MSHEIAKAVSKSIMSSPSQDLTVEFQGGEPTLAWDIIRFMVEYITILNLKRRKNITFVLCTNLLNLSDSMIDFIEKWKIEVSTSLDGPAEFHDLHRHYPHGSAHATFLQNLKMLETKTKRKASPLLTVTHQNLHHLREIIDHYIEIERSGIFIRPLNPFGRASKDESLGYTLNEFADAYIDALSYIIELNKSGHNFREFMASLFFRRILTCYDDGFVDLKFPAGAALSVLVYDINGDVYPSDEARMMAAVGDKRLYMGNAQSNSGKEIRTSSLAKSILNTSLPFLIPGCTTCPYVPYCGVDPVRCFAEQRFM